MSSGDSGLLLHIRCMHQSLGQSSELRLPWEGLQVEAAAAAVLEQMVKVVLDLSHEKPSAGPLI